MKSAYKKNIKKLQQELAVQIEHVSALSAETARRELKEKSVLSVHTEELRVRDLTIQSKTSSLQARVDTYLDDCSFCSVWLNL